MIRTLGQHKKNDVPGGARGGCGQNNLTGALRTDRIVILRTFGGAYIQTGAFIWGLIFRGHFVLVPAYQDFKIYYHINRLVIMITKYLCFENYLTSSSYIH